MRRSVSLALLASVALYPVQTARAHHCCRHGYQPVAVAGAPVAAPLSAGTVLQIVQSGLQFLTGLEQGAGGAGGAGGRSQPPARPQTVPQDVQQTITKVDDALKAAVTKSNAIADLNPLYKDLIKKISTSTSSSSSGGKRDTGSDSQNPFGD